MIHQVFSVGGGTIEVDLLDEVVPEIFAAFVVSSKSFADLKNLLLIEILSNRAKSLVQSFPHPELILKD